MLHEGMSITGFREMLITKHPDNGFVFIYWQLLRVNVDLGAVSSFRTAGAFPCSLSASWCMSTRQVTVLHFPLVSLALCGSYCVLVGFGHERSHNCVARIGW